MSDYQCKDEILEREFNSILLTLYDLTIANAAVSPQDCREIADTIGKAVGRCRVRIDQIIKPKMISE